jgi:hypothetical protein
MAMLESESGMSHPDTEELAAYLSAGLPPVERDRLESHFAHCHLCRAEMLSARELLREAHRSGWRFAVPAAAAAAILALLLLNPSREREREAAGGFHEREAPTSDSTTILAVQPGEGASVAPVHVEFAWHARGADPLYRVTVTDVSGGVVWVGETSDTTLALAAEVSLRPGAQYLWYVDALDVDGRSATTGIRRFRVSP